MQYTYTLKDKIFSFFGMDDKRRDTYKDINGKGIGERYQETIGQSYDEELQTLVDLFLDNTIVPQTMLSKLIPHREADMGNPVVINDTVATRRKILRYIMPIYLIRSTALSYEVLLRLLGFDTVVIVEHGNDFGFDSPVHFDDPLRHFDTSSRMCGGYSIDLTGTLVIDTNTILAIQRIVKFLEPINSDLREIIYNGIPLDFNFIIVLIQSGSLYYDNSNDPGILLSLTSGELFKDGGSEAHYLLIDGYLYYSP